MLSEGYSCVEQKNQANTKLACILFDETTDASVLRHIGNDVT